MSAGSLSPFGLAGTLLARGPLRASALGLCLAATFAVAWALPLTESVALRSGLREALAAGSSVTVEQPATASFDAFIAFQRQAADRVEAPMSPYLTAATVYATIGSLPAVSVNDGPAAGGLRITAAYLDGLAAHVEVLAGALPPDGLGGPLPAVTMPAAGADQLGVRLGDRLCAGLAPDGQAATWCARVVAMWRPLSPADTFWAGSQPRLMVALGRYDFFELLKLAPAGGALAGRRYGPDLSAIGPASAADAARRLRHLRASFAGAAPLSLEVSLDSALARYAAAQEPAALTLNVLMTGLAVLALCLVQLTASRMVDLQARDVALLRARGWPPGPAWRLLFGQLCGVAALALPVGLAGAGLVTAATAAVAGSGAGPAGGDLAVAAGALAAVVASAVVLLAVVAWSVASREPGNAPAALGPAGAWWRRWNVDLPLAGLAFALVFVRPAQPVPIPVLAAAGDVLRFMAPVLAVTILGLVALRALPLAERLAARVGGGLSADLAAWQLGRRPDQHAGLVFFLVLAVSTAGFCALSLAAEPRPVGDLAAIHSGRQAVLAAVLVAVLAMGLAGSWLHFRAAATARRREYAALALNGLPASVARSSLGVEQVIVLAYGIGIGVLLALALIIALLTQVSGGGMEAGPGDLLRAGLAWAALPAGLAVVSWLVRRESFRGDLLRELAA